MNQIRRILLTMVIFFGLMAPGLTTLAEVDFSGSFNGGVTAIQFEGLDGAVTTKTGSQNTLRLNFKDMMGSSAKLEGSFDLTLLSGSYVEAYLATLSPEQDPSVEILGSKLVPLFETRKLYLSLFWDQLTLTVGRQIINYGVGYVFSPIDCFSTVDLQDAGFSRKGSDILRVQVPLGDLAGLEGVITIPGEHGITSAIKVFANLWDYDCSLTGIYKQPDEEFLLGLSFKGDLGVGIHGELVAVSNAQKETRYFEGVAGVDYSFLDGRLFLLAEYYYNGNPIDPGTLTPAELLALKGVFLGREYLLCQASYTINELCAVSINGIRNLAEETSVGMLQFRYNAWPKTNLVFSGRFFQGDLNGIDFGVHPQAQYTFGVEYKF